MKISVRGVSQGMHVQLSIFSTVVLTSCVDMLRRWEVKKHVGYRYTYLLELS